MYKHSFLDYLELIENCRNSEDELFYLNTEVELRNFRKNGVWRILDDEYEGFFKRI